MDVLTQSHLTMLRDLLTYRRQELRAEVHAAEQARRLPISGVAHEVEDRMDEAARQQSSEMIGAQERRDIVELDEVLAALGRLDSGTYGDCVDCGEPIPMPRLLMQPAAQRCAECQTASERGLHRTAANLHPTWRRS